MTAPVATPTPRRGRPRARTSASDLEPREQILRAAAVLFSSRGIAATRLADIAESVGVTAPAIYYHFANFDEIVDALLDYVVGESAAFATSLVNGPGTAPERLHALILRHVERLTAGPYDLWFVAGMSEGDRERHPSVSKRADAWRRAVVQLTRAAIAEGAFVDIDPALAVAVVSGLVYGALQHHHHGAAIAATEIADLAIRSLTRPAPTRPPRTNR